MYSFQKDPWKFWLYHRDCCCAPTIMYWNSLWWWCCKCFLSSKLILGVWFSFFFWQGTTSSCFQLLNFTAYKLCKVCLYYLLGRYVQLFYVVQLVYKSYWNALTESNLTALVLLHVNTIPINPYQFFVVTVNDESLMGCPTTQPTTTATTAASKLLVSFPGCLCRQHVILCVIAFRYNMQKIELKYTYMHRLPSCLPWVWPTMMLSLLPSQLCLLMLLLLRM